jgi:predicted nucleotidyltransferase
MRNIIDKSEYSFIRTNPDLNNIIYLVLSGSHAYGTSNEDSDFDLRGVLVEPSNYVYGLKPFEQFEDLPTDTVIYGLKKFAGLLARANPNTLELLGVENDCIIIMTEHGKIFRDRAEMFLSKRVINSFGSYAVAQLRRLQNALCHDSHTEEQQQQHLQEILTAQLNHFQMTYTKFPQGSISIYSEDDSLRFNIDLKSYPISDFVGIYSELSSIVKNYNKLNHRNKKKSDKSLRKHAMHLIRLLLTGIDILSDNGIITKRSKEHELLMDIRNGKIALDDIFKLADEYKAKFELAAINTKLPDEPNMDEIDRLLIKVYREVNIGNEV